MINSGNIKIHLIEKKEEPKSGNYTQIIIIHIILIDT